MKLFSARFQLWLIGLAYAAIVLFGVVTVYSRYLFEVSHPDEVLASSGMYAGGDMLLEIFLAILFTIPTLFLVRLIAQSEAPSSQYAKFLVGLTLTAPIALAALCAGAIYSPSSIAFACFWRLSLSPFILFVIGFSRWMVRFDSARRLITRSLLIEVGTLVAAVAAVVIY